MLILPLLVDVFDYAFPKLQIGRVSRASYARLLVALCLLMPQVALVLYFLFFGPFALGDASALDSPAGWALSLLALWLYANVTVNYVGALTTPPNTRLAVACERRRPGEPRSAPAACKVCLLPHLDEATRQCRTCGTCIEALDHHCPFIGCIGRGNYAFFILFLVYLWLGTTFASVLSALMLQRCVLTRPPAPADEVPCREAGDLVFLAVPVSVFWLFASALTSFQLWLYKRGVRTGDWLRARRTGQAVHPSAAPLPLVSAARPWPCLVLPSLAAPYELVGVRVHALKD